MQQSDVEALLALQAEEYGVTRFQTPILKICQALTKEVKEGDAEAGEFLNTLTSESYGNAVEFVIAYFQRGRSASDKKTSRYYVSIASDIIPDSWKDLVGEEFVGTRFDEYPEAEEMYKKRVNAGEIKWEKGPLISTTYNYTGLVLPPQIAPEIDEDPMPVRISFVRTTKSAHDKLDTMRQTVLRNRAPWDVVFELSTASKSFGRNDSFIVNVKKGRNTTTDERLQAVELAQAVVGGNTHDNAIEAEAGSAAVAPDAEGGLGV